MLFLESSTIWILGICSKSLQTHKTFIFLVSAFLKIAAHLINNVGTDNFWYYLLLESILVQC